MLRVVGGAGDPATRIENRIGEPAANPYLYMAAQIHAGLDGLRSALAAAARQRHALRRGQRALPTTLGEACGALQADAALCAGLGPGFVHYFCRIKRSEIERHAAGRATRPTFERREYFGRI